MWVRASAGLPLWGRADAVAPMSTGPSSNRSTWILLGLVIGAVLGGLARVFFGGPELEQMVAQVVRPLGSVFLRIIFMIVVPLIISAIVLGVAELGNVRRLGRVGIRCLLMTLFLSGISVVLGITLVNVVQPGRYLDPEVRTRLLATYSADAGTKVDQAAQKKPLTKTLLELIPENPLEEAVNSFNPGQSKGGLLAVMVFSLFVGTAMTILEPGTVQALKSLLESIFAVSLKIIDFAMALAPFGVACLSFALLATTGWDLLGSLAVYVVVVVGGMALHQFGVYALVLRFMARKSPLAFYRESREAMITAFSTSSSNATLPVSLRVAEEELRLPPQISRFVLTVGASANQNGTALYEGVTVLFLAQVFGVQLDLTQQIVVALMCILAGIGTAGVPGGSLPLVVGVLISIDVPAQSIAIILGIDRFLDMCRSALNVTGDLVIASVVAAQSGDTLETAPQVS